MCFGLANTWVWLHSNTTVASKAKVLAERIIGQVLSYIHTRYYLLLHILYTVLLDSLLKDDMWIISPKLQVYTYIVVLRFMFVIIFNLV